jgi:hypothetical protein
VALVKRSHRDDDRGQGCGDLDAGAKVPLASGTDENLVARSEVESI